MTTAIDLTPMLGELRPEAQVVDDEFAAIDRAAAQAEVEALELDDTVQGDLYEYERPYIFGDEQRIDLAFPASWLEARGAVIA